MAARILASLLFLFSIHAYAADAWIMLNPTGALPPAAATNPAVVYDERGNRLILFWSNRVWVLTNANGVADAPAWTELTVPPVIPARVMASAVYDAATNRLIVYGGSLLPGTSTPTSEVWVLTNANGTGGAPEWTRLTPTGTAPRPRRGHTAVYDAATNRMMVFGGCSGFLCHGGTGDLNNDVWVLTNANGLGGTPAWVQLQPSNAGPSDRVSHAAGYDPATNRMIVFGGDRGSAGALADAWVLANANGNGGTPQWIQLPSHPTARYNMAHGYNARSNQLVVTAGVAGGQLTNSTWSLENANGIGQPIWVPVVPLGTPPSPRDGLQYSAGLDMTNNRLIVFGGTDTTGPRNDTWVLTLDTRRAVSQVIPQAVAGGGWKTVFTIYNNGSSTEDRYQIDFFDQTGRPMMLPLQQDGGTIVARSSTGLVSLPSKTITVIETDASGPLMQGYARFTAVSPGIRLTAVVRHSVAGRPDFEAVASLGVCHTQLTFVFDHRANYATGIALVNEGARDNRLLVTMNDRQGRLLEETLITIPANGHTAFAVPTRFPITTGQVGTVEFRSFDPAAGTQRICGLGYLFNPTGAFTTRPPLDQ